MTGIGLDGKIIAVEVLDASNETPGLGQNVTKKTFWQDDVTTPPFVVSGALPDTDQRHLHQVWHQPNLSLPALWHPAENGTGLAR